MPGKLPCLGEEKAHTRAQALIMFLTAQDTLVSHRICTLAFTNIKGRGSQLVFACMGRGLFLEAYY